ncbi:MAG: hypothetical protein IJM20_00910 [Clostridia bacterium]|nr:hypothetical protein [Clostridia bacterium]
MKKNTARILALVLAAVMVCALLAACASKPSGTYKLKTIDGKPAEDEESFTFNSDGTGTYKTVYRSVDFTWSLDGSNLYMNANGMTERFEYKGNSISGDLDGELYVYSK